MTLVATGIYLKGEGRFLLLLTARDPLTGKMRFRRVTVEASGVAAAERERERLLRLFRDELGGKEPRRRAGLSLAEYSEVWLEKLKDRNRDHVIERNRIDLRVMVLPILGEVPMGEFSRQHVVYWAEEVARLRKKDGRDYAKATRAKAWRILRSLLNDAVNDGLFTVSPVTGYIFRPTGLNKKVRPTLTTEELGRFFQAATVTSLQNRAILFLSASTGMRFGEVAALNWEDLDLSGGTVTVSKSVSKKSLGEPKSGLVRLLPLHPHVVSVLKEHRKSCSGEGLVFRNRKGEYKSPHTMRGAMKKILLAAGVEKSVEVHSLRRGFNDLLRRVSSQVVTMSLTGHVTEAMHLHYSHVSEEEKRAALTLALHPVLD